MKNPHKAKIPAHILYLPGQIITEASTLAHQIEKREQIRAWSLAPHHPSNQNST